MEKNKTYKWGILGLGKIARKFAEDLLTLPNAELYAVGSRDLKNANEFAQEFGVRKAYGSYEELAQDPDVDIVYIATPHVYHAQHSILCMGNKKNVLCEKPFAMDLEQVESMIACAKENDVFLMEAMWTRFLPHFQYALELVTNNTYGKLISVEADFGFKAKFDPEGRLWKKSLGGGSLLDIGIYPIFAALSFIGYPDEILAAASMNNQGVDQETKIIFKYSTEQTTFLRSTLVCDTPTEAIIYCENATIRINGMFHEPSDVTVITTEDTFNKEFDYKTIGYSYEAQHAMTCLDQGRKQSDLQSWQHSRELISVMDEVRIQIGLQY